MILNNRYKRPVISFGLSQTSLVCDAGDEITIWQNEIYNQEHFSLLQNEVNETITLTYSYFQSNEELKADFIKEGDFNSRGYYLNEIDFNEKVFIFWNGQIWILALDLNINTGEFSRQIGSLELNIPLPVSTSWIDADVIFTTKKTTSNINTQSFTFEAVESKSIQIQMKSKDTGELLLSNKLELTINN